MEYYTLIYEVVDDFVARREPWREAHLQLAREAYDRGDLLLGGALGNPANLALLVFRVRDRTRVEDFARRDPYVVQGLVAHWEVQPWTVVVGP